MASPQLENGFTRIANELLEALYQVGLVGGEWDLVMCIARASYGWSQKAAPISIRKAAGRLGKHYSHVKRTARELMARGILRRVGNDIMIVKDYEQWGPSLVPGTVDGPGDHRRTQGGTKDAPIRGTNLVPSLPLNSTSPQGRQPRKESSKESTKENSVLTLAQYLERHPPEGQDILRQTVTAIASTRKSGKVAQSVLDSQARKWDRFPPEIVLRACQVYLDRRYAEEGKAEAYLWGIIRQEAKRSGNGREPSSPVVGQQGESPRPVTPPPKTQGQLLIERAARELTLNQEQPK